MCFILNGAYQYNTKGNQTWLTFDADTTLSFSVYRSGKDNNHENFIDFGEGVNDYGWYNLNTGQSGSFNNGLIASFTENDKIGLWVKDNKGDVYLSTKTDVANYICGKSNIDNDIIKIYGGNKGSNGTHEYYVFQVVSVVKQKQPNGQPLPGIIATLIIGSSCVWYLKNRKNLLIE